MTDTTSISTPNEHGPTKKPSPNRVAYFGERVVDGKILLLCSETCDLRHDYLRWISYPGQWNCGCWVKAE